MKKKNDTIIKLKDVSKIYGEGPYEITALDNVNLDIKEKRF